MLTKRPRKPLLWLFILVPLLLLVALGAVGAWFWLHRTKSTPDPQLASLDRLAAASSSKPQFDFEDGFPRWFSGRVTVPGADSVEKARSFFDTYRDLYGLSDPNLALQVLKTGGDQDQFVTFFETYQGYPVYGGQILVMLKDGQVITTLGPLLPAGLVIDTSPIIQRDQVPGIARAALGAPDAPLAGEIVPVIYDPAVLGEGERKPRLAWQVAIRAGKTWDVLVDAQTGEVLHKDVLAWSGYDLDLEDANYNSAENSGCYWGTTDDDWIADEEEMDVDYLDDGEALNTWHHARDAYYFFLNNFGVDGYTLDGGVVEVYVHANVSNAQFDVGTGCDMIEFSDGWVSLDVMVHEYTHGVIAHSSQIGGTGQPGSLAECFGDTMSMLADPNDWLHGEDRTNGQGANRRYDSWAINHMDLYDPGKSIYANMGIPCTAGYKLAVGGTQNALPGGVGRAAMVSLFYTVMFNIPNGAGVTFMDVRNMAVSLAEANWDPQSACQVKNAFAVVGLGTGDWECDGIPDPDLTDSDNDWTIDAKDNCPTIPNADQKDYDHNGIGDACDLDIDGDSVDNTSDNCPRHANPDQADSDHDGKGDACDDEDGDYVLDAYDNCPHVANGNQVDHDDDGLGDACDPDLDGDGRNQFYPNNIPGDNCPYDPNPDQADSDGDGMGDVCDGCPYVADEATGSTYVTPGMAALGMHSEPYQPDSDGDGIPDACDNGVKVGGHVWSRQSIVQALKTGSTEVEIHLEPGAAERVPLPICAEDRDGWTSQDLRQQLALSNTNHALAAWVSDAAGRTVASPVFEDGLISLEFPPRPDRDYFLNFINLPGSQQTDFALKLSQLCGAKAYISTETPPPLGGGLAGTLISKPLVSTLTATPTSTLIPSPTQTFSPTSSLTFTSTFTLTPSLTFTPTFSLTPTASPPTFTLTANANCRIGPDVRYDKVATGLAGQSFLIEGRNLEDTWYFVRFNPGWNCWFAKTVGTASGDLSGLRVFYGPPLPTDTPLPLPACSSYKDQANCQAAGCTWAPSTFGPGYCK